MKQEDVLLVNLDKRGIATLTLNRPEVHNAFDEELINQLIKQLEFLDKNSEVRVLVLRSMGKSFSAGADLNWMRRMADYSEEQNYNDAMQLATLMQKLNNFSKPTIVIVQGSAFGGAVGLVACCDIAIGCLSAKFSLSEVSLGLIPAVISPYVLKAIGERVARRYFLSAEIFEAPQALRLGLLHEIVESSELENTVNELINQLLKAGPKAQAESKDLIFKIADKPINSEVISDTAKRISFIRSSEEGKEGINAFLQKRLPDWVKDSQ